MFGWLRRRPRLAAAWRVGSSAQRIPDAAWQATLTRYGFLTERAGSDLPQLRELAAAFLQQKQFHGAHGFRITDEVALSVATQAVLPALHLPGGLAWYDDFVGIVIHPGEALAHRRVVDELGIVHEYDEVLAGEAMERGPVMLSWQDVLAGGHTQAEGYNVVIHEFAHKIDMRDGLDADGCPPLPRDFADRLSQFRRTDTRSPREAWFAVLQPAFEAHREASIRAERFGAEPPWLDEYGAGAIGEFFAVACEAYFVNQDRFTLELPVLRSLFDAFFLPPPPR